MRRVVIILALFVLSGCSRPATPDTTTAAGYRQMAIERGWRVAGAVNTANDSCSTATVAHCQEVLEAQEESYLQQTEWLRESVRPAACDRIAANYTFILAGAKDFFGQMKTSAATNDQAAVRQTAKERMISFNQSWTAFNNALPTDPCQ